jgi:hypothetical protein
LKSGAAGDAGELAMNIQHSTFNAQHPTTHRRFIGRWKLNVGCWMFLLACLATPTLFAQANFESTNAPAKLLPPYDELPASFWEQHGAAVVIVGMAALALIAFIIWRRLRPKSPVILPPEVQARTALEALRQRPEDGACLSRISQILRRYFIAAFHLPPDELTTAEFSRAISGHAQVGVELAATVTGFLGRCDEQKFSPAKPAAPLGAVDQALALIAQAEARRAPTESSGSPRA